jgi:rod shape-determining protein MreC
MSADGSAFGIVYPHFGTDEERYFLELRGVPFRASLKPGMQIFTSGLGGTFPRGIPIGTVIREQRTAEGWTRTYLVRPAVSPANLTAVMVLSPQRVSQGVGNVWAAVGSVDSAARRIVAAGDSLARDAARAEAAARRAAQDSARRLMTVGADTAAARDTVPPDTTRRPRPRPLVSGDSAVQRRRTPPDSAKRDSARSDTARRPKP